MLDDLRLAVGPTTFGPGGFVEFARYANGETAMVLRASATRDSEPQCKATVCLDFQPWLLAEDEVVIKTWSENAGVLEALEQSGVLKRTGEVQIVGHACEAHRCKLTVGALAELKRQREGGE